MQQSIYGERLRFDGLEVLLGATLDQGVTSITFDAALVHAGGLAVPDVGQSKTEYVPLSILDINNRLSEIVYLTSYIEGASNGTVVRAQEDTSDKEHALGAKVVHAGTVEDFVDVLDHEADPAAHAQAIRDAADSVMKDHLTEHENDPTVDPHPVYVRKQNGLVDDLIVTDTLVIRPNARLVVQGNLVIEGHLVINGYEIVVGPTKPDRIPDNLIWIQTVT
jgi:hypothetical protein